MDSNDVATPTGWYALKLSDFDSSRSSQKWSQSGSSLISGRIVSGFNYILDNCNSGTCNTAINGNPVGVFNANTPSSPNQMWTSTGNNFILPFFKKLFRFKHLFSVRETSFIDCVLDELEDMVTSEEFAEAGTKNFKPKN